MRLAADTMQVASAAARTAQQLRTHIIFETVANSQYTLMSRSILQSHVPNGQYTASIRRHSIQSPILPTLGHHPRGPAPRFGDTRMSLHPAFMTARDDLIKTLIRPFYGPITILELRIQAGHMHTVHTYLTFAHILPSHRDAPPHDGRKPGVPCRATQSLGLRDGRGLVGEVADLCRRLDDSRPLHQTGGAIWLPLQGVVAKGRDPLDTHGRTLRNSIYLERAYDPWTAEPLEAFRVQLGIFATSHTECLRSPLPCRK
ncbi:hypothetical protein EJ07DRAFT_156566 [Lizonia empirigonia]|nr:hypothetical protein EJ07DRAFT_156566 [Lizonia empirigonia]